jgi:hypothetical protein
MLLEGEGMDKSLGRLGDVVALASPLAGSELVCWCDGRVGVVSTGASDKPAKSTAVTALPVVTEEFVRERAVVELLETDEAELLCLDFGGPGSMSHMERYTGRGGLAGAAAAALLEGVVSAVPAAEVAMGGSDPAVLGVLLSVALGMAIGVRDLGLGGAWGQEVGVVDECSARWTG